jgi:hypothetical protein
MRSQLNYIAATLETADRQHRASYARHASDFPKANRRVTSPRAILRLVATRRRSASAQPGERLAPTADAA